jgi:hypothetical protein
MLTEVLPVGRQKASADHAITRLVGDAGLLFRRETPEGILHIDAYERRDPVSTGVVYSGLHGELTAVRRAVTSCWLILATIVQLRTACASNADHDITAAP